MRYIGSKTASLPALARALGAFRKDIITLCDPFAGTCTVSRYFKQPGIHLITGDVLYLSHVLQLAYLGLNRSPSFRYLIAELGIHQQGAAHLAALNHLNQLVGSDGFIAEQYSPAGPHGRAFFTAHNARRIDSIRGQIHFWNTEGLLTPLEHAYLLASLLEATDRVANTAGTYYAYLKHFSRKAEKTLYLKPLPIASNRAKNYCLREDALSVISRFSMDVLYLDPPYNERDYAAYYHLPETLARGDSPEVRGKAGLPVNRLPVSRFCRRECATEALQALLSMADCQQIILHYSPAGVVQHSDILALLSERGPTTFEEWEIRAYQSRSGSNESRCLNRLYICTTT